MWVWAIAMIEGDGVDFYNRRKMRNFAAGKGGWRMGSDEKRIKERYDNAGTTEGDDGAARCAEAIPRCG